MPYSPLISKIRCHNPNRKKSSIANRNYLTYIAQREGVDITEIDSINDLLNIENVLVTDLNENVIYQEADNTKYLNYMAKRPRSHGLFGNINTDDLKEVASQVYDLTKKGKNIYRGIISLSQMDAEALGYTNKDSWYLYLNKVMPDIANELGVSMTNFTWVAAYHAERRHPHVHYELWDNTDRVKSPFIHTSKQNKCRVLLSEAMFDNEYEAMIKEVYQCEREELTKIRNINRKELTDITKELVTDIFVPGMKIETLPDRISIEESAILSNQIIKLSNMLPTQGSSDYAYLDKNIKDHVYDISSTILKRTDMQKVFSQYISAVSDGQKLLGKTKFDIRISVENAENDIYKRISNIIIKKAKEIRLNSSLIKYSYEEKLSSYEESDYTTKSNIEINVEKKSESFNELFVDSTEANTLNNLIDYDDGIDKENNNNFVENNYYLEWNDTYKEALNYLYNNEQQDFLKAISVLNTEALKGNILALHELGKIYDKGIGIEVNKEISDSCYKKVLDGLKYLESNQENAYIEYRIAKLYESGKGTEINNDKAYEWYKKAVEKNHKFAQYSLALMYLGNKIPQYYEYSTNFKINEAKKLLEISAEKGNAYAAFELAKLYEKEIVDIRANEKMEYFYQKAFNGFLNMSLTREDDNLLYRIGCMYLEGKGTLKNEEKAINHLEISSKLNNINAQYKLAKIYLHQGNTKQEDAIKLLQKLSNTGNAMAQYTLGSLYLDSNYIQMDKNKAIELLTESSNNDNQFAQYKLGTLYAKGDIVEKDIDRAIQLLKLSAEHNNDFAQYNLGKIYSEESSRYDLTESIKWYEKSVENGNQYAQYKMGLMYYKGNSINKNLEKAIDLLLKSASQDNQSAQYTIANIYNDKESKFYNVNESIKWYQKSAERGNQYAEYQLGKIYCDDNNICYDLEKGIKFLTRSADKGNEFAQSQLGNMYLWGKNIEKDEEKGIYWLNKAISQGNEFALNSLKAYDSFSNNASTSIAYNTIKLIFNMLNQQKQKATWNVDKVFRSRSKQAIKEESIRQSIQGEKYDYYQDE